MNQTDRSPEDVVFPEAMGTDALLKDRLRRTIVPMYAIWDHFFDAPNVDLGPRDQPQAQEREAF